MRRRRAPRSHGSSPGRASAETETLSKVSLATSARDSMAEVEAAQQTAHHAAIPEHDEDVPDAALARRPQQRPVKHGQTPRTSSCGLRQQPQQHSTLSRAQTRADARFNGREKSPSNARTALLSFLCQACNVSSKGRSTVCCRSCFKLFHPRCAGFSTYGRMMPPKDWICPACPGGQRGMKDSFISDCFRGKGLVAQICPSWCPVCFEDLVLTGQGDDGVGIKCPGCGLRPHISCVRRRDDGSWPCKECQCRREKTRPPTFPSPAGSSEGACGVNRRSSSGCPSTLVETATQAPRAAGPKVSPSKGREAKSTSETRAISPADGTGERPRTKRKSHPSSTRELDSVASQTESPWPPLPALNTSSGGRRRRVAALAAEARVAATMAAESEHEADLDPEPDREPDREPDPDPGTGPGTGPTAKRSGDAYHLPDPLAPKRRRDDDAEGDVVLSPPLETVKRRSLRTPKTARRAHDFKSVRSCAAGSSRPRVSLGKYAVEGASRATRTTVSVCTRCQKPGKPQSGKKCGGCERWWHDGADCAEAWAGVSGNGNWMGGWRCKECLRCWQEKLKLRASRVMEAWIEHEAKRKQNAANFEVARQAALAESTEAQRFGYEVAKVEVPPISHPPAGILPFLDADSIGDTGFRLARISADDCVYLGPEGAIKKVDLCWEQRIFAVIGGVFDPQKQPLMDFLGDRKGLSCRISGKAAAGEASSTMGDYRAKLADRMDTPRKDSPGTFFLDTASGQADVLNWLPTDPLMGGLMPESARGGLSEHILGERCKFGPFTFGGGRNFPLESIDAAAAGRQSQRQYMKGKGRDRIGGSTTHIDGMGSFTAIGGIKDGVKSVTAFETADCAAALAIARFKAFAKPGGSSYVVNDRIDDDLSLRHRLKSAGIRFSTFPISAGEAYLVPSGALHEFMNLVPCLSVAWNIMPHPANCGVAMDMAEASAREAEAELGVNTDRSQSAIEHAPPEGMRQRHAAHIIKRGLARRIVVRRSRRAPDSEEKVHVEEKAVRQWAEHAAKDPLPAWLRKKYMFTEVQAVPRELDPDILSVHAKAITDAKEHDSGGVLCAEAIKPIHSPVKKRFSRPRKHSLSAPPSPPPPTPPTTLTRPLAPPVPPKAAPASPVREKSTVDELKAAPDVTEGPSTPVVPPSSGQATSPEKGRMPDLESPSLLVGPSPSQLLEPAPLEPLRLMKQQRPESYSLLPSPPPGVEEDGDDADIDVGMQPAGQLSILDATLKTPLLSSASHLGDRNGAFWSLPAKPAVQYPLPYVASFGESESYDEDKGFRVGRSDRIGRRALPGGDESGSCRNRGEHVDAGPSKNARVAEAADGGQKRFEWGTSFLNQSKAGRTPSCGPYRNGWEDDILQESVRPRGVKVFSKEQAHPQRPLAHTLCDRRVRSEVDLDSGGTEHSRVDLDGRSSENDDTPVVSGGTDVPSKGVVRKSPEDEAPPPSEMYTTKEKCRLDSNERTNDGEKCVDVRGVRAKGEELRAVEHEEGSVRIPRGNAQVEDGLIVGAEAEPANLCQVQGVDAGRASDANVAAGKVGISKCSVMSDRTPLTEASETSSEEERARSQSSGDEGIVRSADESKMGSRHDDAGGDKRMMLVSTTPPPAEVPATTRASTMADNNALRSSRPSPVTPLYVNPQHSSDTVAGRTCQKRTYCPSTKNKQPCTSGRSRSHDQDNGSPHSTRDSGPQLPGGRDDRRSTRRSHSRDDTHRRAYRYDDFARVWRGGHQYIEASEQKQAHRDRRSLSRSHDRSSRYRSHCASSKLVQHLERFGRHGTGRSGSNSLTRGHSSRHGDNRARLNVLQGSRPERSRSRGRSRSSSRGRSRSHVGRDRTTALLRERDGQRPRLCWRVCGSGGGDDHSERSGRKRRQRRATESRHFSSFRTYRSRSRERGEIADEKQPRYETDDWTRKSAASTSKRRVPPPSERSSMNVVSREREFESPPRRSLPSRGTDTKTMHRGRHAVSISGRLRPPSPNAKAVIATDSERRSDFCTYGRRPSPNRRVAEARSGVERPLCPPCSRWSALPKGSNADAQSSGQRIGRVSRSRWSSPPDHGAGNTSESERRVARPAASSRYPTTEGKATLAGGHNSVVQGGQGARVDAAANAILSGGSTRTLNDNDAVGRSDERRLHQPRFFPGKAGVLHRDHHAHGMGHRGPRVAGVMNHHAPVEVPRGSVHRTSLAQVCQPFARPAARTMPSAPARTALAWNPRRDPMEARSERSRRCANKKEKASGVAQREAAPRAEGERDRKRAKTSGQRKAPRVAADQRRTPRKRKSGGRYMAGNGPVHAANSRTPLARGCTPSARAGQPLLARGFADVFMDPVSYADPASSPSHEQSSRNKTEERVTDLSQDPRQLSHARGLASTLSSDSAARRSSQRRCADASAHQEGRKRVRGAKPVSASLLDLPLSSARPVAKASKRRRHASDSHGEDAPSRESGAEGSERQGADGASVSSIAGIKRLQEEVARNDACRAKASKLHRAGITEARSITKAILD